MKGLIAAIFIVVTAGLSVPGSGVLHAVPLVGADSLEHDVGVRELLLQDTVDIAVLDIELSPSGETLRSDTARILTHLANHGNVMRGFPLLIWFGLLSDSVWVDSLAPAESLWVASDTMRLSPPGVWICMVEAHVPDDIDYSNNVMYDTFWVSGTIDHDVGVVSINSPAGSMDTVGMLDVTATVRNYGDANAETFWTFFSIFDETNARVYCDSVRTESLAPGASADLAFDQTDINAPGLYTARCSTYLVDDENWTNNLVVTLFQVMFTLPCPPGWFEVAQMTAGPSGKPVKHGGWAATHQGNDLIYVAKGYKTTDFYSYDPAPPSQGGGSWTTLSGMPYSLHPLWGSKVPRKGAKGAADHDNRVYVTQGNNTLGWWYYDIAEDTWYILSDVPLGPSRKKVKGGADLAYVPGDTDYVYCLKGYRGEFYRYNIARDVWEPLDDVPTGACNRLGKGSWLVWDEDRYLYACKAKYHELCRYDLEMQRWDDSVVLSGMPFIGMTGYRKKSKAGASAAYYNGFIWALKGGNTQEWWKYDIAADTWTEKETIPSFGSTGRKKRVKYGADVVHWGTGVPLFFTAKGNKTVEFWGYLEDPQIGISAKPSGSVVPVFDLVLDAMPNPFRTCAVAGFSLPRNGDVDLAVYTSAGCRVRTLESRELTPGHHLVAWDGRDAKGKTVPAGIYCLRLVAGDIVQTRKVVKLR
ncbi:MAG: hypothetical protein JSU73_01300 [candidate division WOR-3 bacterium]|nr:MAG: hypothetical protein JSU73_01300 [candidate division WOR-3 bacterium]